MTSTTVPPPRPTPRWLKSTLLAAAILTLCWAGAIAYWRTVPNAPATGEMLALLAAPLGLLSVVWLGKKRILARAKAAPTAAATALSQPAPPTPSTPPLAILAAALRAPHGASPEELAAAIETNTARPDLDPELLDDAGFPITSARSDAAVDETVKEEIGEWLMASGLGELHLGPAQWRAFTLGTAVVRDLAGDAVTRLIPPEGTAPQLRLLPILPAAWTVEQRHAAGLWFAHTVAQSGWPADKLTRIALAPNATLGSILGQCAARGPVPAQHVATILVACDSQIEQAIIDTWMAERMLFTPARLQGLVPGEGAAGLLMTHLDHVQSLPELAFTLLQSLQEGRLASSADENKRSDATLLSRLAQQTCKEADIDFAAIAMIAADTGSRPNRVGELMAFASSACAHLDTTADIACVGISSGSCGAVPFVTALALAQYQATMRGAPVLYVSNDEAQLRSATLVRPAVPQASPA